MLYGARHYNHYDFLLTLSDHTAHFGLEHHQSSDDRIAENGITDPDAMISHGGLLPHEMTHSWNGKYRRPAGLATPDYQQPMKGELLWVYEGMTQYFGTILTARSGEFTQDQSRDEIANVAAYVVKGIHYQKPLDLVIASLVLGILNAVLRPILLILALPLLVLTLGVFLLVLNALVLYFVGYLLRPHFYVMDFSSAFWGALIISVVTIVLNSLTGTGNARVKIQRGGPKPPDRNDVIDV